MDRGVDAPAQPAAADRLRPAGRQQRVRELVFAALGDVARPDGRPVSVLDCGGGSGRIAVPLAQAGARVTVVDISVDALAVLRRRAAEVGVAQLVEGVPGDIEALGEAVPAGSFDLALVHEVLEVVDRPEPALVGIARALRAGGLVSILATNPAAGVLSRALAGDLTGAVAELRVGLDAAAGSRRLGFDAIAELCARAGLQVEQTDGVGVFDDLVPGAPLDAPGGREALAELETLAAARSPYRDIAGRLHVLARRGG
jgi:S-adenosylmethionine-dependent methyltransferase